MPDAPDLDQMRLALATSTLGQGLRAVGDRWTVEVILGAFIGLRRFDEWKARSQIPRSTLSERLKTLIGLGLLRAVPYQQRPVRHEYRLTDRGRAMYGAVLMIWDWERRFGDRRDELPRQLRHADCGSAFRPVLCCEACGDPVSMDTLSVRLRPRPSSAAEPEGGARAPRVGVSGAEGMALGLRVDRWTLMIVTAVILGCHYFDQLCKVLDIVPSVLSRRLAAMVEGGLLQAQEDRHDGRRRFYRLTPRSRGLLGYLTCFDGWSSRHLLREASSIQVQHTSCGRPFFPSVACDHCLAPLDPARVAFTPVSAPLAESAA